MSVCYNKARKKYFICYDYKMPDGSYKTMSIYNKEWTKERGKKFVQAIEQSEIEKDIRKRKLHIHSGDNITLEELYELFEREIFLHFAKQTAKNKRNALKQYFTNHVPLHKTLDDTFTVRNIEDFKSRILSSDLKSPRINDVFRFLKEFMNFASEREYITYELARKLCNLLKPVSAKNDVREDDEVAKLKFWTNEEWDRFYNSFEDNDYWRLYFEVHYKAALRIGEALGLKWKDLNSDNNTLFIRRSVDNDGEVSAPKNRSSIAPVSIPRHLVDKLLKFKEDCCATDEDYIFFAWRRTIRKTIVKRLNKHIEISGVPTITPHGLRHSCASRMINMGLSPLMVSKHLRHASVKETLDTYSHLFPSETVGVIEKVFD